MKIKVRCTGRAENTDKDGSGIWTYAFVVDTPMGMPSEVSIQFSLHSKKQLHFKREEVLDLNLDSHTGIEVIKSSNMTQ